MEDEKAAADESRVLFRFFVKGGDRLPVQAQLAEAPGGIDGRNGSQGPMLLVELDGLVDVAVGQPITIREKEGATIYERQRALQAPAGLCLQPGVEQSHGPVFFVVFGVIGDSGRAAEAQEIGRAS